MRFCPKCGKRTKTGFCKDCKPVQQIMSKDIILKVCSSCKKIFIAGKWTNLPLNKALEKTAQKAIKDNVIISPLQVSMDIRPGLNTEYILEVRKDQDIFNIPATVSGTYCSSCSKEQGGYFEGVMQLRNINEEIEHFVESFLRENNLTVKKKRFHDNGIDIAVSDKKKLQALARILVTRFGGTFKMSPHLFSRDRQTSRDVYRLSIYYKAPNYKKGDVVKAGEKLILVSELSRQLKGTDLATGKKISVDIKGTKITVLPVLKTTVSKVYPELEVLDPETYQSVPVKNKKDLKVSEKVRIVIDEGKIYVV
jgi:NMD protein affecting ribosome stability and mRNA decay